MKVTIKDVAKEANVATSRRRKRKIIKTRR